MPLLSTTIPALLTTVVLTLSGCASLGKALTRVAHAAPPAPDCRAWVGADRNQKMEGYLLATPGGGTVCVPVGLNANAPPAGYQRDF